MPREDLNAPDDRSKQQASDLYNQQMNRGKQQGDNVSEIPSGKTDVARLQSDSGFQFRPGDVQENVSTASSSIRGIGQETPRNMSFAFSDGNPAISGKEFKGDNGQTMLLTADHKTYQANMAADGQRIQSWQQVGADGKPAGPVMNVAAEKSGVPPHGMTADRYMEPRRNPNESQPNTTLDQVRNPQQPVVRENHQQQFAPPPDRSAGINFDASRTARQNAAADTAITNNPNPGADSHTLPVNPNPNPEVSQPVVKPAQVVQGDSGVGTPPVHPNPQGDGRTFSNSTPEYVASMKPVSAGISPEVYRNLSHNQRTELVTGPGRTLGPLEGRVSMNDGPGGRPGDGRPGNRPGDGRPGDGRPGDGRPGDGRPGDGRPGDGRPGDGRPGPGQKGEGRPDLAEKAPGKADAGKHAEAAQLKDALAAHEKGAVGKAGEGQIDAKLLAQLQGLGRNAEGRQQLADLIAKFQDGKLIAGGKEAALADIFKGMKPDQLSSLQSFLRDGGKHPLDFKSLDPAGQRDISRILDIMNFKGDRGSGRLVDMLSDRSFRFDKVPGSEQSRMMMAELFKGMSSLDGRGLRGLNDPGAMKEILGRSLGERGGTELRLSARDMGPVMQAILAKLQSRDMLTIMNTGDRASNLTNAGFSRMDAGNLARTLGQAKDLGTQNLDQSSKAMQARDAALSGKESLAQIKDSGNTSGRLPESVKDAISRGDVGRALGQRDLAQQNTDGRSLNQPRSSESATDLTGAKNQKSDAATDTTSDSKVKAVKELEEAQSKRKKDQEDEDLRLRNLKQKELDDKDEEKRKKFEEEEKERLKKLEEEKRKLEEEEKKRKEEEAKKYQDQEFSYTVEENETLISIAGKFSGRTPQVIYARNEGQIALHDYKGRKYAKLFKGQKIIIPNRKYIDDFKKSMRSFGHIDFNKIPFVSAEEELAAWQAGAAAMRSFLGSDRDDDEPRQTRSFSGKEVSKEEKQANIEAVLGERKVERSKYPVKLGEGLRSIAQKLYDKPAYWRLLAYMNDLSLDTDLKGNPLAKLKRGDTLELPSADEIASFDYNPEAFLRGEPVEAKDDPIAELAEPSLQEVLLNDDEADLNFNPQDNAADAQDIQEKTVISVPHQYGESAENHRVSHSTAQHPLPKAELGEVKIGFEDGDPVWTASTTPEKIDDIAYIVESEMLDGDTRGLSIMLQVYSSGEWLTAAEYQVFPHASYVIKYGRSGERQRQVNSLPPKQSMQMARNNFRKNWQNLFREYWHG